MSDHHFHCVIPENIHTSPTEETLHPRKFLSLLSVCVGGVSMNIFLELHYIKNCINDNSEKDNVSAENLKP